MNAQEEEQARAAACRAEQRQRWRRASILLASVALVGLLVGLMLGRVVNRPAPVLAPLQVLAVHAAELGPELLLNREPVFQRSNQRGAVHVLLPGARLAGGLAQGSLRQGAQRGSWRMEQTPRGVEVLLVSLAGELDVELQSLPHGQQWQLSVQARLLGPER